MEISKVAQRHSEVERLTMGRNKPKCDKVIIEQFRLRHETFK